MSDRLDLVLARAVADGVLPEGATRPPQAARPWPVVLLTALGAWLAAVPLLGVVGLLLGDLLTRGVGPYFIGVLVLAGAGIVLRARDVPLFLEQLAVPALLVGAGSLGFGLFRDLPDSLAAATLAAVALGLAIAISHAWLRVLLGSAAAMLTAIALVPRSLLFLDIGRSEASWLAAHAVLSLWLAGLWIQHTFLNDGAKAAQATAIESIMTGWLLALLSGLAVMSGATFLVGASLGGGFIGDVVQQTSTRNAADAAVLLSYLTRAISVALALAAAGLAARAWPTLRQPLHLAVALVLAALCWFLPALGAVLLALAVTATTQRFLLAGAAALAAAWIIGSFYYALQWELATKAAVLVMSGALLAVLAWLTHFRSIGTAGSAPVTAPAHAAGGPAWLIAVAALATLAVANIAIWQKENLIAHGQPVFVELAPVDPRSLMQGDFMRLNFRLPPEVEREFDSLLTSERPHVVARRNERGVARILRLHRDDTPLEVGEFRIELTPKDGRWVFVTDAWFFKEGDAVRWEAARFGEFRVDKSGKALLVGMADAQLKPIAQ